MFFKKTPSAGGAPEYLIVGLGNPGQQYENTRHNAGFMAGAAAEKLLGVKMDRLRHRALTARAVIDGQGVLLMEPQTYMNLSGESVGEAARFYKVPPERVLVFSDEMALPPGSVRIRHYDARMVIPLTWDEESVTECAFVTRAFYRGRAVDQLQMHLRGGRTGFSASSSPGNETAETDSSSFSPHADVGGGGYRIVTACFDERGNEVVPAGVCPVYETGSPHPTFAIVRPAVDNTRVDMSPYGQSVFADAVDAIQAVDLAFDAMISEVDSGKMRVFLSDVLFDQEGDGSGRKVSIPFGRQDCTVFRKVMSTEDTIQEFAPALRTDAQVRAFRTALQMLGDLTGFGLGYFDFDGAGYVKTATEVSADNSALMRNIRRHEHALEGAMAGICRAVMAASRSLGVELPDEGEVRVTFDDSIITDTSAEKRQDMAEVASGLMNA